MLRLHIISVVLMSAALAFPSLVWSQATAKTVTCADGSTSKAGKGACSNQGGVVSPPIKISAAKEMVTCKDGTTAKQGRGACARHGGVSAQAADVGTNGGVREKGNPPAAIPSSPPPTGAKPKALAKAPTDATALCKDGTYSHAQHQNLACSKHGGVKEWLKHVPK